MTYNLSIPAPLDLKKISFPTHTPGSLYERIEGAYQRKIQKFVEILQQNKWFATSMVLGTLLSEPLLSIKAGLYYPLGWKKAFHFHNFNPKAITEEQR